MRVCLVGLTLCAVCHKACVKAGHWSIPHVTTLQCVWEQAYGGTQEYTPTHTHTLRHFQGIIMY